MLHPDAKRSIPYPLHKNWYDDMNILYDMNWLYTAQKNEGNT